jgi:hypothetical protein
VSKPSGIVGAAVVTTGDASLTGAGWVIVTAMNFDDIAGHWTVLSELQADR